MTTPIPTTPPQTGCKNAARNGGCCNGCGKTPATPAGSSPDAPETLAAKPPRLVMGPVLFHWDADQKREFYARLADQADIDTVHIGEVVCSKRQPFFDKYLPDMIERLQASGKQVVLSTLALVMDHRELSSLREMTMLSDLAEMPGLLIEANDISAVSLLRRTPHVIGPYINIYNQGTLRHFIENGAVRICLPWELPLASIIPLARARQNAEIEIQLFGRMPLAISARCYSARANGLHKDGCRYVCGHTPDGMDVQTLDQTPFLAVNGLQTLSSGYGELSAEIPELLAAGVGAFRLSPHVMDMAAVARIYRLCLAGRIDSTELRHRLHELRDDLVFANGFAHGMPGANLQQGHAFHPE